MIGTKLANYEITAHLGSGGMGEVYEAIDSKLGRSVAIKFLPQAFAHDNERVTRLQREARVLASLSHPNIAAIHGLEEIEGRHFLVMELVPGETLARRLERGPIELDDALVIAGHIADALEAAHEKGVVHRDLKPANIKVSPDGKVKVLDFGLAKTAETNSPVMSSSNSPTLSMAATQQGVILGTAAYMSPEQARGKVVDKRTDIWAFGVVLYEMIAGKRLFEGEDLTETLASVVKQQPDLTALPAKVRRVIEKCLQKDPQKRLRDISGVALLLEGEPVDQVKSPTHSRLSWAIAAGLAVSLGIVVWAPWRGVPVSPDPVFFQFLPPERNTFGNGISVSPDGRHIAFIGRASDGNSLVWVRSLNAAEARPLPGTDGAANGNQLFWSPDSRWIGFATYDKLKKVEASGGPPQTICDLQLAFRGGAWNRDGIIIFGMNRSELFQVPASGGKPAALTKLDSSRQEISHVNPSFLPDGRNFVYSRLAASIDNTGSFRGSLDTKPEEQDRTRIAEPGGVFAPSADSNSDIGYLLFERERSLMAQPFDVHRLALRDDPISIGEVLNIAGPPQYSGSANGVLAFRSGTGTDINTRLIWFDREGKQVGQLGPPGGYSNVHTVRENIVVISQTESGSGFSHTWIADPRGVFRRLNPGSVFDGAGVASADGRVAFTSAPAGAVGDLYWRLANGEGQAELLFKSPIVKHPNHWSADGQFLIYDEHHQTQRQDLWIIPMGTTGGAGPEVKPIPFLVTAADETFGQFSPEGKWVAYDSDESGRREVYVQGFAPDRVPAAAGGKWTISLQGGHKPRWRHDGKELFYLSLDGKMMSVPVKMSATTFEPGVPVPLFETNISGFMPYDVAPNGRFLINTVTGASTANSSTITVVLNWEARLRK